jgi:hypothetical protein
MMLLLVTIRSFRARPPWGTPWFKQPPEAAGRLQRESANRVLPIFALCGLFAGCLIGRQAQADICQPDPYYGTVCTAQVDFQQFAQSAFQTQQQDEWCWAASISMIWAFFGFHVSQSEIVNSVYGSVVDFPAQTTQTLLAVLDGQRVDDAGNQFVSSVSGLYDASSGIDTVSYASLGNALSAGHPIMIGVQNLDGSSHAVVLTAIKYYQIPGEAVDSTGGNIIGAGVFDPWPGNGARPLSLPQDLTPSPVGGNLIFAAVVNVAAVSGTSSGGGTASKGGGAFDLCSLFVMLLILGLRNYNARRLAKASTTYDRKGQQRKCSEQALSA